MTAYASYESHAYPAAAVAAPLTVTMFTLLRQSLCRANELGYPELTCECGLDAQAEAGEAASKLTAAFSIHMDSFLGLSHYAPQGQHHTTRFVARFSERMSEEAIEEALASKAADIIDTLLALG